MATDPPGRRGRTSSRSTGPTSCAGLIAAGAERGYLTFEEIAVDARGGRGHQGAGRPSCTASSSSSGVDVIAVDGVTAYKERKGERGPERESRKRQELDLTVEPSLDSLRLYLRSIGKVRPAHRRAGGRARQADRARRHGGQAAHGRGQPAPGRLDRQGLPGPRPQLPRPDPGGVARADPRRSRSSTTAAATSSRPTRPGGSARRSRGRSPTRRGRSGSRSTWSRS